MNAHLQQRVKTLLQSYHSATLATCGPAGPQISIVACTVEELHLHLSVSHSSDHLFNLETQPLLVLMTAGWRLHGQGHITEDTYRQKTLIVVTGTRLHILNEDGQHITETIDF